MEIREVMYGNIVMDKDGSIITISGDDTFFSCQNYTPVKLTEDWLLKLGFKNNNSGIEGDYQKKKLLLRRVEFGDRINPVMIWNAEINSAKDWVDVIKCPYVHQLQNLYWCLCGEELTIK